eukprot:7001232-Pyramimonas_sp.AAC.2
MSQRKTYVGLEAAAGAAAGEEEGLLASQTVVRLICNNRGPEVSGVSEALDDGVGHKLSKPCLVFT